jgi:hypothetical protein
MVIPKQFVQTNADGYVIVRNPWVGKKQQHHCSVCTVLSAQRERVC